jgi:N-acetylneuraminic acid mutarotase
MASLNGVAILFGGAGADDDLADTWTFDGTSWAQLDVVGPSARDSAAMAPLGDNLVLFGGEDAQGNDLSDTWTFDGTSWTQLDIAGPSARDSAVIGPLGTRLILFGGVTATTVEMGTETTYTEHGDTWAFDGDVWTQLAVDGPTARSGAVMGFVNGDLLLYGGLTSVQTGDECGDFNDTWTWNGTAWSQASVMGPGLRALSAATSFGQGLVLFGGLPTRAAYDSDAGTFLGCIVPNASDTWLWNGSDWAQLDVTGPPASNSDSFTTL